MPAHRSGQPLAGRWAGPRLTRHALLGAEVAAGLGGAVLGRSQHRVPESAFAVEASPASSLSDIEHVVVVMQENRSFDHYFGTLSSVRGWSDPAVPTQSVGGIPDPVPSVNAMPSQESSPVRRGVPLAPASAPPAPAPAPAGAGGPPPP